MESKFMRWSFIVTLVLFFIQAIYTIFIWDFYFFDFVLLSILISLLYYYQKPLKIIPLHFFLACLFLLIHGLGVFGIYNDTLLHGYFGFAAFLILFRLYKNSFKKKCNFWDFILLLLFLLGLGAIHELFEFVAGLWLGAGEGVFLVSIWDTQPWDVQIDLLSNLVGGIVGALAYTVKDFFKK